MSLGSFFASGTPTYVEGLSGRTLIFETVQFDPPGMAFDQLLEQQEELSDVGVNYRRWRRINKQFRPFKVQTTANFATYLDAVAEQRRCELAIASIGDLNASLAGTSYRWKFVKVLDCIPRLASGVMVGTGISSSAAVIIADWSFVLTRDAGSA